MRLFSINWLYIITVLIMLTTSLAFNIAGAQTSIYQQAFTAYQAKNYLKAEQIWLTLSDLGDPNAQYALGMLHQKGLAKEPTAKKSHHWFKQAAKQNQLSAMFNLGVSFWEGVGIKQNKSQALHWWHQAAKLGETDAQFNLGLAYYVGDGVEPDQQLSTKWLSLAAAKKHKEAIKVLKVINIDTISLALLDTTHDSDPLSSNKILEASTTSKKAPEVSANQDKQVQYWKTSSKTADLFVKPNNKNAMKFLTLRPEMPVIILSKKNGWSYISLPWGLKLWIAKKYIHIQGDQGIVTGVNVRARPRASLNDDISPAVGKYHKGDTLKVLEIKDHWVRVRASKHIGGWTKTDNLVAYHASQIDRKFFENQVKTAQGL